METFTNNKTRVGRLYWNSHLCSLNSYKKCVQVPNLTSIVKNHNFKHLDDKVHHTLLIFNNYNNILISAIK